MGLRIELLACRSLRKQEPSNKNGNVRYKLRAKFKDEIDFVFAMG
jgi:hypothetical protein